jgi:RNA polymerase sigma-70 factor (ECF subfamily)
MDRVSVRSDEDLMLAVAEGDLDAFEQIVLRHRADAWRVAYRFTGDAAEAEDLAQEAFLRILDAAGRYKPTATFRTYLFRILNRLCIDHARRKRPTVTDSLPQRPDGAPSAIQRLSDGERDAAIRAALDKLPPAQRMAVVLRYFQGLSVAEIAEAMDTSVKAVEGLLARARERLESVLAELMEDF